MRSFKEYMVDKEINEARKLTDSEKAKVKKCQEKCSKGKRVEFGTHEYEKYAKCVSECKKKVLH